jgi:hypothetical protein
MYFNKWLAEQLEKLPITRAELSEQSGVSYSSMNGAKRYSPRLCNLVLLCEVLNEVKGGDLSSFNALIISAIAACGKEYTYAAERLQEKVQ